MNKIGTGGNITLPREKFLVNDLDAYFAGVYADGTSADEQVLLLKKLGFDIRSFNNTGVSMNVEYAFQATIPGQVKVVSYDFYNDCPCRECEYDYGIDILIRHKIPGYFNDFLPNQQKPYSGTIKNINCISGVIDPLQLNQMRDNIINQINADLGYMNEWAGANVIAGQMLLLQSTDAWAADTIVINGISYGPYASRAAAITAINLLTDAYAYADPLTATGIYLMANATPTTFVVTATNLTVPTTYTVGIMSKSVDWTFEVQTESLDATGIVVEVQPQIWSFLTADDVFREMAGGANAAGAIPGLGDLGNQVYGIQPIKGAAYVKYTIQWSLDSNNLHGGSTWDSQKHIIDIYIRDNVANLGTAIWDAINLMAEPGSPGFTPNTTWAQLLALWVSL